MSELTQEEVRRLFDYDPDSGVVTRRMDVGKKCKSGDVVGCKWTHACGKYYFQVVINYKLYYLHRVIWMYVHGEFPDEIDHIDGNGLNNRLDNLRNVSSQENGENKRIPSNNTSGHAGVCWHKALGKWMAYIAVNRKQIYLGYFDKPEAAAEARKEAEVKYGFHVNHGQDRPL